MNSMCIYAVQFTNGVIKVGRSGNVKSRLRLIQRDICRAQIVFAAWTPRIEYQGSPAEAWLIDRMAAIGERHRLGSEFFVGAKFGEALTLLKQVHRKYASDSAPTGWRRIDGMSPVRLKRQLRELVA